MRKPEWLTENPDRWPPEARLAYSILARAAMRRAAHSAGQTTTPALPRQEQPVSERS